MHFSCDATGVDEPTSTAVTADIAAAESDFEAYTLGTAFDETEPTHLLLLKMILDKMHVGWHHEKSSGGANAYSSQAGSISGHGTTYTYYKADRFDALIDYIVYPTKTSRVMRFIDNTTT